jgi:virulence factor
VVRIGLVDVTTTHADAFSKIFNVEKKFPGFQVTTCWDPNRARAEEVAKAYGLTVADSPEAMKKDVDAAMCLSRNQDLHLEHATPFLKRGLPTFVDKTTAGSVKQAIKLFKLAQRKKAPVFSSSAIRFGPEVEEAQKIMKEKMGPIKFVSASGPGDLVFYGQHVFDTVYALVGKGARTVQNIGDEKISILKLTWESGLVVVMTIAEVGKFQFRFTVGDEKSNHSFVVPGGSCYERMMTAFVQMVNTRQAPIDPLETVEIIDGMFQAKASREKKGRVMKIKGQYVI